MSKIEWTDLTWNPIIGCSKISEGCKNCYAEKMANRLSYIDETNYYNNVICNHYNTDDDKIISVWNGYTYFVENQLNKPLLFKKPKRIFVCSMGDLFHEKVPFNWIIQVFNIIKNNPHHTFQILTKRPHRADLFISYLRDKNIWTKEYYLELFKNVWLGITIENQKAANERIPILLNIPTEKRFVSCEPLLSNIDLKDYVLKSKYAGHDYPFPRLPERYQTKWIDLLDWVIVGPETGSNKRPMQKEWIQNIYDQCKESNVPFFDKKNILGLNLKKFPK